ncbi:hypothetical protein CSPX01_09562 [Colletotrichum filicis]|nr:hypothetical protein CSPX01_09562 [Colletotrichum filicis]
MTLEYSWILDFPTWGVASPARRMCFPLLTTHANIGGIIVVVQRQAGRTLRSPAEAFILFTRSEPLPARSRHVQNR